MLACGILFGRAGSKTKIIVVMYMLIQHYLRKDMLYELFSVVAVRGKDVHGLVPVLAGH